jgi:hypothetical protein
VKIPGIGEVKTPHAVAGGAFLFGVIGYAYYKSKKSSAAAAAAAATTATTANGAGIDSTGAGNSGVDPNTGLPYAEETGSYGSTYGGINPATGYPYYDNITQSSQTGNPNAITTNSAWIQQAESDAQNLFGYTSQVAQSGVGKYISQTNAGLQPSEYQMMQSVVAELGQPPEHGPYRLIQAPGTPSGGGGSGGLVPGSVIQVPVAVQGGNTMQNVARLAGIDLQHLIANNPGSNAGTTGLIHVPWLVKPGDTVHSIATELRDSDATVQSAL